MANNSKTNVPTSYGLDSRTLEHLAGQSKDIARRGTVAKTSGKGVPFHPHMANRTNTTLGAPPTGAPPDASGPNPLDPSRAVKAFKVPAITHGMKSDPLRGRFDPNLAAAIFGAAMRPAGDFVRDLHAVLPDETIKE